jgi:hypothetical protein
MRKLLIATALLFLAALPTRATQTLSQHLSNISCGHVASCSVTGFSAIAAGSFILGIENGSGAVTATAGTSGGGTWVVPSGCTTVSDCSEVDATAGGIAVQYILSSTSSPTSITCTASAASIDECEVVVYTFTGTSMAFDVGNVRDQTSAGTSFAGVSAGTLTGTSDIIVQYAVTSGNMSGCPNSAASPADFPNGNGACGLINSTNNAAGTWTLTSGTAALGSIAFKETGGGGGGGGSVIGGNATIGGKAVIGL